MKRLLLTALLLVAAPALAQTAPAQTPAAPVPASPVPVGPMTTSPTPISDEAIFVAYPPATYAVAFDHVLLEGSVKPGATLSLNGRALDVGGDGLFIEWVPLTRGENVLRLESTLAGVSSARELRVTSTPPMPLSGAAQIVAASALPAADRVA